MPGLAMGQLEPSFAYGLIWDGGVDAWPSETRCGVTGKWPLLAELRAPKLGGPDQEKQVQSSKAAEVSGKAS